MSDPFISPEHLKMINDNAARVAWRYSKRCRWASYEDIRQEALLAQVTALSTYDPDHMSGAPLGAYTYISARRAVVRLVLRASAPVSSTHRETNLLGVRGVDIMTDVAEDAGAMFDQERADVSVTNPFDAAHTHREEWSFRVRSRLVDLVGAEWAEFALMALTHEFLPAEIAAEHDVSRMTVYRAAARLKLELEKDDVLAQLWKEDH